MKTSQFIKKLLQISLSSLSFLMMFFALSSSPAHASIRVYGQVYYQAQDGTRIGLNGVPIRYDRLRDGNSATFSRTTSQAGWFNNQWVLHTKVIAQDDDGEISCVEPSDSLVPVTNPNGWYVFKQSDSNSCPSENPQDVVLCTNERDVFTATMPSNYQFPYGVPVGPGHFEPSSHEGIPDKNNNMATYIWDFKWVPDLQPPSVSNLTVKCQGNTIKGSIAWTGTSPSGTFWVDIATDSNFATNVKEVGLPNNTKTFSFDQSLSNMELNSGSNFTLQKGQAYYARVWNDYLYSTTQTFVAPDCAVPQPTTAAGPQIKALKIGQGENTSTINPTITRLNTKSGDPAPFIGTQTSQGGSNYQNDVKVVLEAEPGSDNKLTYYTALYNTSFPASISSCEELTQLVKKIKDGVILKYDGNSYSAYSGRWTTLLLNRYTDLPNSSSPSYSVKPGLDSSWLVLFDKSFGSTSFKTAVCVEDSKGKLDYRSNIIPERL